MADDIITRDDNGDLAVNVVVSTEANVPYNYDDCFTLDTNNRRALRVVGAGGGDSHNKGYFATQAALEEAYPTGEAGDYAIVGATDTVWLWDEDNSEWVDSDTKGQVTSVNGQTGAVTVSEVPSQTGYSGRVLGTDGFVAGWVVPEKVQRSTMPQASEEEVGNIYQYVGATDANYTNGYFYKCVSDGQDPATYSWTRVDVQPAPVIPDPLPSQTGQSGKFLTTDGTNASWSDKAVVNNATVSYSIAIGDNSVCEYQNSVAIGRNARVVGTYNVAIGSMAENSSSGGQAGQMQIAIGYYAKTRAYGAIQLGMGTNSNANTFKVGNDNGNFEIMSADGTIPADRLVHAINWYSIMPTAGADNLDDIIQFTGATDANYTNGYFYKCVVDSETPASATIAQTTGNTLSDLTVDATTFWDTLGDYNIPQQTGDYAFTYNDGTGLWYYEEYGDFDLADFGVTYTGTPADGDVLTISATAPSATYSWTRVDVQPSGGGSSYTAGTGIDITSGVISVTAPTLQNTATGSGSITIGGSVATQGETVNIGTNSSAVYDGVAIGYYARVMWNGGVAIGYASYVGAPAWYGIGIGCNAESSAVGAIQLGIGTNNTPSTFSVGLADSFSTSNNYRLLDSDGTIPEARLADTTNAAQGQVLTLDSNLNAVWQAGGGGGGSTAVVATLAVADWSNNSQTVNVTGVTANNNVIVAPAPASQADYTSAGILCTAQGAGTLTFTCTTTPSNAITVNVLIV